MEERREVVGRSAQHGERATTEREGEGETGRKHERERGREGGRRGEVS